MLVKFGHDLVLYIGNTMNANPCLPDDRNYYVKVKHAANFDRFKNYYVRASKPYSVISFVLE